MTYLIYNPLRAFIFSDGFYRDFEENEWVDFEHTQQFPSFAEAKAALLSLSIDSAASLRVISLEEA